MTGGLHFIIILNLCLFNIINADLHNSLPFDFEKPNCDPNKIYKANNITCICTETGEWPNDQCYLHFQTLKSLEQTCEPDKFIFIDCNVCRCGHDSKVDKDQCTKHKCNAVEKTRRSNSIGISCEPNRWYSFAPCRICYCVDNHKLICNNENKSSTIRLVNYEFSDCGEELLLDMKELLSEKKNLRFSNKNKVIENKINKDSSIESEDTQEIDEETSIKYNQLTANKNEAKSKVIEEESDMPKPVKRKIKKSKLNKVSSDIDWKGDSNKNLSHILKINLPNVFDNILSLVLRKSLVSLNSGKKCKPGSITRIFCNTCFCLANGKMLCTEKECK